MASVPEVVEAARTARTWDQRISIIRRIPEDFGLSAQPAVHSAIARAVYVPMLAPDFAYVHWRPEYRLDETVDAYEKAAALTSSFRDVDVGSLTASILAEPTTLRIFRLFLGLLPQEFAAAAALVENEGGPLTAARVKSIESGRRPPETTARACARIIHRGVSGELFPPPTAGLSLKTQKPDTDEGWKSIRWYADHGVPLPVFLHQRHYGGAFRQLLDATSGQRGDLLENAVEILFSGSGVPFIRTGSHNQGEVSERFGLTVRPAPDFVVTDSAGALRAILECKGANDGGTARDKAARYRGLRQEALRLGVPLFAVLGGLGWRRTGDALGPVVRDTDGRVFMLSNLNDMLTVQPFASILT